ncbi:MAG: hypothetical protein NXI25_02540 [bacterium]|nr:hypothetical protein [bacterium]
MPFFAHGILRIGFVLLLLAALQGKARAQASEEEFVLRLEVEEAGAFNVSALIDLETNTVKLPVRALLQAFHVKVGPDTLPQTLSGFYLREDNPYQLSFPEKSLFVFDTLFQLEASALTMHSDGSCYMELEYWGRAFRLPTTFDLRSLTAKMKPSVELPVMRNARLQKTRERLGNQESARTEIPDTVIGRQRHWLRGGGADYQVNWRSSGNGQGLLQARVDAGLELLGGRTLINLQHTEGQAFLWEQQNLRWSYAPQQRTYFSGVEAGILGQGQGMLQLFQPRAGVRLQKDAVSDREAPPVYTIRGSTVPGWVVEVYRGHQLLSWQQVGEKGSYRFEIPLRAGMNRFAIRELGPSGEEHTHQESYYLPAQIPEPWKPGYTIESSLLFRGGSGSYHKLDLEMGITPHLMMRGGLESYSGFRSGLPVYFVEALLQPSDRLSIEAGIAPGFRQSVRLGLRLFKGWSAQYSGERYNANWEGLFIPNRERHEINFRTGLKLGQRKISIQLQGNWMKNTGPWRHQYRLRTDTKLRREVSVRLEAMGSYSAFSGLSLAAQLNLSKHWKKGFTVRGDFLVNLSEFAVNGLRASLARQFSKRSRAGLNFSRGFARGQNTFGVNYSLTLGPMQLTGNAMRSGERMSLNQSVSGSVFYSGFREGLDWQAESSKNRSGILLRPFVDNNHNHHWDEGEYAAEGLEAGIRRGKVTVQTKDTVLLISGLSASEGAQISLSAGFFEDIFWKPAWDMIRVVPDPNQYKTVAVPILPFHEAFGYLPLDRQTQERRLPDTRLYLYNANGELTAQTTPEPDGYFSFTGIAPGRYWISVKAIPPKLEEAEHTGYVEILFLPSRYGQALEVIVPPDAW